MIGQTYQVRACLGTREADGPRVGRYEAEGCHGRALLPAWGKDRRPRDSEARFD